MQVEHRRRLLARLARGSGAVALALPALVVLAGHAARYLPFLADDALISLRYAQRLLAGEGLTWTDGAPVEGYSNLLWVLGCAALGLLSVDLIDAARILGGLSMGCALLCVALSERESGWQGRAAGGTAALAVALVGGVAVWAIGGLEQPLVAALLALGLLLARPLASGDPDARVWPAGLALGLLCLTRPDGALLAGLVGLGLVAARGLSVASLRLSLRLGTPSLLAVLGQLAFRVAYYGDVVPNTARAKLALTTERLASGWHYVLDAGAWTWPLLALALPALLRPRRVTWLPVVPLLGWVAYVVFIGGDIFPARRHMVTAVVCLGFVIATSVVTLLRWRAWMGVVLAGLLLGWQAHLSALDGENLRAIEERWEWEGQVVGRLLGTAFAAEQPLLAADPAGCLPYFSELPALDLLGLNDRYLATHPPADFGRGFLGHELGDGDYVWSQQPDLLVLCSPRGSRMGCFRSGRELLARPDFRAAYTLVEFEGRDPTVVRSSVWVRREGRIGVRHAGETLVLPGFLLVGTGVLAVLDGEQRVGAAIPPAGQASTPVPGMRTIRGATAPTSPEWDIEVEGDGAASASLEQGRVVVRAGSGATHVRAVRLTPRTRAGG